MYEIGAVVQTNIAQRDGMDHSVCDGEGCSTSLGLTISSFARGGLPCQLQLLTHPSFLSPSFSLHQQ